MPVGFEKVMIQFRLKYPEEARLIDGYKYNDERYGEAHDLWIAFREGYIAGRKSTLPPEQQAFLEQLERLRK